MSLPESMSRIVIAGPKSKIDETIEALYQMKKLHLIDHTNGADEGYGIGSPRPYSSKTSERLLSIKAAEKELGINPETFATEDLPYWDKWLEKEIENGGVEQLSAEILGNLERKNQLIQTLEDLNGQLETIKLLSKMELDLEDYWGYDCLTVFLGMVKEDPREKLAAIKEIEVFANIEKKTGGIIAVFAKNEVKDKVSEILTEAGFSEVALPLKDGKPAAKIRTIQIAIESTEKELAIISNRMESNKNEYAFIVAAYDEQLSADLEKGQLPLRIATSEYSFIIDAWIPTADTEEVKAKLEKLLKKTIHIEVEETRGRTAEEEKKAEPRFKTPPSKQVNGRYASRFEYPVQLVSMPKYQEIDPAAVISIFFPFFFGFMVGDLGYAIPFIVLGGYGILVSKSKDFKAISTVLFFGGIWAAIFGFFFFGEMLGMHFIQTEHTNLDVERTWDVLLNIDFPQWFKDLLPFGTGISKTHDVTFLLKLSVYMGVVHLAISYLLAFLNASRQHGWVEGYLEKGGWLFSLTGVVTFCFGLTEVLFKGGNIADNLNREVILIMVTGLICIIIGVVSLWKCEKAQAVLELPGIVGNVLSYTRLAAIGMSKAGMALAFNYMTFIMMGVGGPDATVMTVIFGCLIFLIGHLMIWVLAILSAGLHGLRLQYVESMNKFFEGGGVPYSPLSITRTYTKNVEKEV